MPLLQNNILIPFLAVIFCDLGQFTFQRFNCPKSYTFTNARLQGGLQAGQFRRLGPPDDTELCVQRCCDQSSCDLVAWVGEHCYSVTCVNRELCKPVRLPSYHKGMRLLYIASRENAEDEGGQSTKIQTVKFYYSYATYDLPKLFICKEPVGLLCRRANETLNYLPN